MQGLSERQYAARVGLLRGDPEGQETSWLGLFSDLSPLRKQVFIEHRFALSVFVV